MKFLRAKDLDLAEKIEIILSYILTLSLLFVITMALFNQQWTVLFISALTLFLFFLPAMLEKRFRIHLPVEIQFVIVLFIYAALFLGEIKHYYTIFWWWDVILHAGSSIGFGFAGFIILYILTTRQKVRASPFLIAMFSFCFALAIGALWEIFEFLMDGSFALNMQKSGLVDTMWDLIVDSGGALFTAGIGYIYIRGGNPRIFSRLLRKFIESNPKLFRL